MTRMHCISWLGLVNKMASNKFLWIPTCVEYGVYYHQRAFYLKDYHKRKIIYPGELELF